MGNGEHKFMCDCFLCSRAFQFGPHRYEGRRILAWDIMVCDTCYGGNHDGIVPTSYPHLVPHLEARGIQVVLNTRGWLPFPA